MDARPNDTVLSQRVKVALFESDRQFLKYHNIGYSEFIRACVHARITQMQQLKQMTP